MRRTEEKRTEAKNEILTVLHTWHKWVPLLLLFIRSR